MSVLGRCPLRESRLSLVGIKGGRRKMVRGVGGGRKARNRRLTLSLPNPPPFLPSSHFDTCHAGYLDTITGVNTGSFNRKYRKKRLKQTKPSVPFTKGVRLTQGSTVFELFLLYPAPHARVLHLWERYSLSLSARLRPSWGSPKGPTVDLKAPTGR